MSKAIKWAWVHGSLTAEVFDTLEDAISDACDASGRGEESLDCIEHEGEQLGWGHPLVAAEKERRYEEWKVDYDAWDPALKLEVQAPDDRRWVTMRGFMDQAAADSAADEARALIGPERVRLTPIPPRKKAGA